MNEKNTKLIEIPEMEQEKLRAGCLFDERYKLGERIGAGGMGTVFRAVHVGLDEEVAIKVLRYSGSNNKSVQDSFLREARTLRKLDHPNILKVTDAGASIDGEYYIASELLDGQSFEEWTDSTPVEARDESYIRELLSYFNDVLEGVIEFHGKGVVHRDLKLRNVILHLDKETDETVPKILDFGLVRPVDTDDHDDEYVVGTADYMPPEQMAGGEIDERSDIYSLGVMLYAALTGELPAIGQTDEAFSRGQKHSVADPADINPSIPRKLVDACLKALEHNPSDRFRSAEEFSEALLSVWPSRRATEAPRRKSKLSILVPILIVGTLIVAYFVFVHGAEKAEPIPSEEVKEGSAETKTPTVDEQPSAVSPVEKREEIPSEKPAAEKKTRSSVGSGSKPENTTTIRPAKTRPSEKETANIAEPSKPAEPDRKEAADKERIDKLFEDGMAALKQKRYAVAEPLLEELSGYRPRSAKVWYGLGTISFQKRDYGSAISRFERALALKEKVSWRSRLAEAHNANGDTKKAIKEWKRIYNSPNTNERSRQVVKSILVEHGVDVEQRESDGKSER